MAISFRWRTSVLSSASFLVVLAVVNARLRPEPLHRSAHAGRQTELHRPLGSFGYGVLGYSRSQRACRTVLSVGRHRRMPAGQGIVEGGEIPYTPAAAAKQKDNLKIV